MLTLRLKRVLDSRIYPYHQVHIRRGGRMGASAKFTAGIRPTLQIGFAQRNEFRRRLLTVLPWALEVSAAPLARFTFVSRSVARRRRGTQASTLYNQRVHKKHTDRVFVLHCAHASLTQASLHYLIYWIRMLVRAHCVLQMLSLHSLRRCRATAVHKPCRHHPV